MNYSKIDADQEEFRKKLDDESIKRGGSARDLALASISARNSLKENGLWPVRDKDGEWVYSIAQGAKAACFAREDAAITLIVQKTQLDLLYAIKLLLVGCFLLLVFIAYRIY
jgi:hypothetical protein